ncbi:hypothetical protein DUI87_01171 [Hirundo rustica rustica]|uniref:Reverse transcriptase domain-containing protein n=1 Tax=Hirundo rustica rustica TaxID=333673 RepID=A0A3M0L3X9_HIRRU|nr:hypothetical protein DUI87_01171 [Hirundo rustica rustica]
MRVTHLVDLGKTTDVIFSGFSKAFDTVSHSILLDKMASIQLNNHVMRWCSILGPVLFNNGKLDAGLEGILSNLANDTKFLEKRRLKGDLIVVLNIFMRGSERAGTNLFTLMTSDKTQENGMKLSQGRSGLDIKKKVDIPVWVVDLRHELTHRKLLQLALCRKGCDVVLDWLRKMYWSHQLGNNLCEEDEDDEEEQEEVEANAELDSDAWEIQTPQYETCQKHKEFHEKVRDVLISYKNEQFRVMQTMPSVSKSQESWSDSSSEVDRILAQIKVLMQENKETVAEALLSDGFLIPKMDCLKLLNMKCEADRNNELTVLAKPHQPPLIIPPNTSIARAIALPPHAAEQVLPVLREQDPPSELRPQFLISWISELLTGIAKVNTEKQFKQKPREPLSMVRDDEDAEEDQDMSITDDDIIRINASEGIPIRKAKAFEF